MFIINWLPCICFRIYTYLIFFTIIQRVYIFLFALNTIFSTNKIIGLEFYSVIYLHMQIHLPVIIRPLSPISTYKSLVVLVAKESSYWWIITQHPIDQRALPCGAAHASAVNVAVSGIRCDCDRFLLEFCGKGWSLCDGASYRHRNHHEQSTQKETTEHRDRLLSLRNIILPTTTASCR